MFLSRLLLGARTMPVVCCFSPLIIWENNALQHYIFLISHYFFFFFISEALFSPKNTNQIMQQTQKCGNANWVFINTNAVFEMFSSRFHCEMLFWGEIKKNKKTTKTHGQSIHRWQHLVQIIFPRWRTNLRWKRSRGRASEALPMWQAISGCVIRVFLSVGWQVASVFFFFTLATCCRRFPTSFWWTSFCQPTNCLMCAMQSLPWLCNKQFNAVESLLKKLLNIK